MLRHRQQHAAARPQGATELLKNALVLLDVFDDVECANEIELGDVGNVAGVHLKRLTCGPTRFAA